MAEGGEGERPRPGRYRVNRERSSVRMRVGGVAGAISAEVPILSGTFVVGPDGAVVEARTELDVTRLKAGPMVARALKGRSGLDVARFSTVSFVSTGIVQDGNRLTVDGLLTMRGVTHPVRFTGEIARGGPRRLITQLDGSIDRTRFGLTVGRPLYAREATVRIRAIAVREDG
jgi:polyisoprenoid-binding protein YceI